MPKPLLPLKLLITRPEKQAAQLAQTCAQANVDTVCAPLVSYQANTHNLAVITQQLNIADIVIFVSVAAVEFAFTRIPVQSCSAKTIIAVGEATKQSLAGYGLNVIVPAEHTSEGLLQLPCLQNVSNKTICIVRGNGGRELIAQTLIKRKAKVEYLEVYQRVCTQFPVNISYTWQQQGVNAVLLTSVGILESIENLVDLCDNYWKNTCLWLAASPRIATKARALGLKQVVNTNGASDDAIMVVIKEFGSDYDR